MLNQRSLSLALAAAGLLGLVACGTAPNPTESANNSTATPETSATHHTTPASATGADSDVDYMTKLGLMKGHLLVARELLDQQKPDQAEPHIGHPVEEIYADVESQLQARNVKEFKSTLVKLHDEVKAGAKDTSQVQADFAQVEQALNAAMQAVPADKSQSPQFVLQVIDGLLDTANAEYAAAIASDKIAEAIEYQDSRGFVLYAQDLYKQVADDLEKTAPQAQQTISKSLDELATAWPSAIPPEKPAKTPDEVSQLIQTIEQETQSVVK